MKALILAAGVGSRLRPITSTKPKCLVQVAGQSILAHQIHAYAAAGVSEIVIVIGYEAAKVREFCKSVKSVKITLIENEDYEVTNNMYSLYLTRDLLRGQDFLLSNGDVVFDPSIIPTFATSRETDLIAVDQGTYTEESMKVVQGSDGSLVDISKAIPPQDALGNSIDLYKFSAETSEVLYAHVIDTVENQKNLKDWTEVAIQGLLKNQAITMRPFDIQKRAWVEIDNYQDLALADKTFSTFDKTLASKKVFFLDLDGTLYLGSDPISGASDFVERLRQLGKQVYFLSNNSSRSKRDYTDKLHQFGITSTERDIVLSTDALINFLLRENTRETFVVGTDSMVRWFEQVGINPRSSNPAYVVVGYDTELTYGKLTQACYFLNRGTELLATHCDVVCPTPDGPIPDVGALLDMLEKTTGRAPLKVFGKPNPEMIQDTIEALGATPEETVVIGDRLYTDMALAHQAGCEFILVLSGEAKREDVEALPRVPELIVNTVGDIL